MILRRLSLAIFSQLRRDRRPRRRSRPSSSRRARPIRSGNAAFSVTTLSAADLGDASELRPRARPGAGGSRFSGADSSLSANPTTQGPSLRSIAPSGAGRALVTLDGVPQNDPFGGWVIWSSLPPGRHRGGPDRARRPVQGPYGAGALTGVVALSEQRGTGLVRGRCRAGAGERPPPRRRRRRGCRADLAVRQRVG